MIDCEKCQDHDRETKRLVEGFLHQDEVQSLVLLLAGGIHGRKMMLAKDGAKVTARMKMALMSDIAFSSQLLGKFVAALDKDRLEKCTEALLKNNVHIKINHEACPHVGKPDGQSV